MFGRGKSDRRVPSPDMDTVLARMDAAVDRLEGVYAQLVPILEKANGPIAHDPMKGKQDD